MIQRREIRLWVPFAILALAVMVLFYRLFIGDVLFWGLPSLQFYPWRWFAFDELRNGHIPYWNPYNGGGTPLLANYQSAILYPPNWLYLLLPNPHTMGILAVAHIFWAAFGMWLFTGRLELSTLGRGVSLLCFALGSYSIGRLGSFPTVQSIAWMPWLFWATDRVLRKRSFGSVGILGFVSGMQLLAGHAQSTWYALLALGSFALWYVIWQLPQTGLRSRFEALLLAFVGLLLGAGMAAWQLFLTAQFLNESQRSGGVDYEVLTNLSYAPLRAFNLIMPHFFGTPADGSYLTPDSGIYFEDAAYIGVLPMISVVFAVYGWFKWRTFLTHHRVFCSVPLWVFISIMGMALALGRFGPFYQSLYDYVPTFDNFREPVRWLLWPSFALPILAGIGTHYWSRSQRALFWTRLGAAAGAGIALVAGIFALSNDTQDETGEIIDILATSFIALGAWLLGAAVLTLRQPTNSPQRSMALWQLAVLLFVAADLGWASAGLNPTAPDDFYSRDFSITEPEGRIYWFEEYEEEVKFDQYFDLADYRQATDRWTDVRTSLLPNINILDRISLFNNFDPLQPALHRQYVELIEAAGTEAAPLLRAAGVTRTFGNIRPDGWQRGRLETISVSPNAAPMAWVVGNAQVVSDTTEAANALSETTWNPEETVILIYNEDLPPQDDAPRAQRSEVQVVSNQATRKQYNIDSDGTGYLVIAQTWYPGWQARVDGEITAIYQANLAFQAIPIPAGNVDVTLTYSPPGTEAAAGISLLSIFIVMLLIAIGLFNAYNEQ